MERDLADVVLRPVLPVQQDFPAVQVIEAAEQVDDGALAGAGGPDQGDALAGVHMEVHMLEDVDPFLVGEGHVPEVHLSGENRQVMGVRRVVHDDGLVHGLENPLQVRDVVHEGIIDVRQAGDGLPEAADVLGHGEDDAEGDHLSAAHPVDAGDIQEGQHQLGHGLAGKPDGVADGHGPHPCLAAGDGQPLHDGDVYLLPVEQLADAHAVDGFGQVGVVVAVLVALVLPGLALPRLDQDDEGHEEGQAGHDDRGQGGVGGEHEHHDDDQGDDLQDHIDDAVGEDIRDGVDVVDDPHEDLAGRAAVVIAEGQFLQVGEEVTADIMDDPLADVGHHAGTDRVEHDAQGDDAHEDQGQPADHGGVPVRDGLVQHPLGDLRDEQGGDARHGAEQQRGDHLILMLRDILPGAPEVLQPERGLEALVDVKLVPCHYAAPPSPSKGRPYCRQ